MFIEVIIFKVSEITKVNVLVLHEDDPISVPATNIILEYLGGSFLSTDTGIILMHVHVLSNPSHIRKSKKSNQLYSFIQLCIFQSNCASAMEQGKMFT